MSPKSAPVSAPAPAPAPAPKAVKPAKQPKAAAAAKPELEGLTKETQESGVIAFNKGSGSHALLILITKFGFDRDKVLKASAQLKEKGKAFQKCDPAKKYNKVAGIIKKLQNAGYALPKLV